jgi:hypothetical protein
MTLPDPGPNGGDAFNPYAAPETSYRAAVTELIDGESAELEAIRRKYFRHESAIRSLGMLHYFAGFFLFFSVASMSILVMSSPAKFAPGPFVPMGSIMVLIVLGFYFLLAVLHVALGSGLRRFQPWARWTEVVLSSIGLFGSALTVVVGLILPSFPRTMLVIYVFVALFLVYIQSLLLSSKGSMVFSEYYKTVIAATPDIRHKTSGLLKVLAVLFVVLPVVLLLLSGLATLVLRRLEP